MVTVYWEIVCLQLHLLELKYVMQNVLLNRYDSLQLHLLELKYH